MEEMNRSVEWYRMFFDLVSNAEILALMLMTGLCFSVMISPYLCRKKTVVLTGMLVALSGGIIFLLTESGGVNVYIFVMAAAFFLMFVLEREKPLQKIFLCVLFLSLRYLSSALFAEWGFFSIWLDTKTTIFPQLEDVDQLLLEFVLERVFSLVFNVLLLYLMARVFKKVYKRSEELNIRELFLLLIPTMVPLLEAAIFREYILIYSKGVEDGFIKENIPPNFVRFLFYIFSYFAIIMVILLYERVRKEREENAQSEALEKEISGMRQTIEQTRCLYDQIRTLRHDISNHLMTMERLSDQGNGAASRDYLLRLKEEYSDTIDGIRCGDPVIDVVLTGKRDMAVRNGIDFECDFAFPQQPKLDVFDLSVLLNNALDNAVRGAAGDRRWISIASSSREQFFTIVIRNSFNGAALRFGPDGIPVSTKPGEGHGLGLKLIRRIALSYHGDMEFVRSDTEIELRILLHNKEAIA